MHVIVIRSVFANFFFNRNTVCFMLLKRILSSL